MTFDWPDPPEKTTPTFGDRVTWGNGQHTGTLVAIVDGTIGQVACGPSGPDTIWRDIHLSELRVV